MGALTRTTLALTVNLLRGSVRNNALLSGANALACIPDTRTISGELVIWVSKCTWIHVWSAHNDVGNQVPCAAYLTVAHISTCGFDVDS